MTGIDEDDVVALIEALARTRGAEPALVLADARGVREEIDYRELDRRAEEWAARLHRAGVRPGDLVAVAAARGPGLVVALLAVLKAGAAYLPLDPRYPADRLTGILTESAPVLLLSTAGTELPWSGPVLRLDDASTGCDAPTTSGDPAGPAASDEAAAPGAPEQHRPDAHPRTPAYVLYTSGSTGRPKGVVISRGAYGTALRTLVRRLGIGPGDRVLAATTIAFDIAGLELFGALTAGACVVLADDRQVGDPAALAELIAAAGVTVVQGTPALWYGLLNERPARLHGLRALVGGEALPRDLADRLMAAGTSPVNLYGPTETTIWSLTAPVTPGDGPPPIGTPLPGTTAQVLDARLRPVPPGEDGELYLSGPTLATGYLARPGLTAERFLPDPAGPPGARMYRTGDLARLRPDGDLEYRGRCDDQVKVRGFRIELGEVEAALLADPAVSRAAAAVRGDGPERQRLVGYLVAAPGSGPADTDRVRATVSARLPGYMVPAALLWLDRLPLAPNGKLDRRALPEPPRPGAAPLGRAPADRNEAALCALFAELLDLPAVGPEQSFFDLGGTSLLAARLTGEARVRFGRRLGPRDLFEHPSPAALAALLGDARPAGPPLTARPRPDRIPLTPAQHGLWYLDQLNGPGPLYNLPLLLRFEGPLDREALQAALDDLTERHEALRTTLPDDLGIPHQRVHRPGELPLEPVLRTVPEHGLAQALDEAVLAVFDLAADAPLRAELLAHGPHRHTLVLLLHHSAADGWSVDLLARDLLSAYRDRLAGRAPTWPPLPVQYADFALWQQHGAPEGEEEFWRRTLDGAPALVTVPGDRPRPGADSGPGAVLPFAVDAADHAELVAAARRHEATPFMLVHTALAALLTRRGAGTDIVVGTVVAGRPDPALAEVVGHFVNTVPLRTDTGGDPDFAELLSRVRQADLAALDHQDTPFERLVGLVNPPRTTDRQPVFQVLLAFQVEPAPLPAVPGLTVTASGRSTGTAKFDLTFSLTEHLGPGREPLGLAGELEYRADLFDPATADGLAAELVELLRAAVQEPQRRIGA
ncbi:non-ribosomal peptide synthetase [Streptomyces sp. TLI_053]|uniref:non-ribosomal peptide synthetase n=1 Tax=Streptomyces sp. TLI_053 TaxID=1855352 RepID=UPI0013521004|nr:non-ribosomal peptide synthetase [Streptomyces sp. TLI_053]